MRYVLGEVPDNLPVGKHPTRILARRRGDDGQVEIPVEYAPDKRVSDSLMPIVKHADDCADHDACRCGWVHHDGSCQEPT